MITKERVSFAFKDEDEELDRVPFVDIDYIKDAKVGELIDGDGKETLRIEIGTKLDGYNSGRAYHLRTNNSATYSDLLKTLLMNTKEARRNQSSLFKRAQYRARYVYETDLVQSFVALIIMAVSSSSG